MKTLSRQQFMLVVIAASVLVLMCLCLWLGDWSLQRQLREKLNKQFTERLTYAMPSWGGGERFSWVQLAHEIDRDLEKIPLIQPGSYRACHANVLALQGEQVRETNASDQLLDFSWDSVEGKRQITLGVSCQRNWLYLSALWGGLVAVLTGLWALLPAPISARRQHYIEHLQTMGLTHVQASQTTAAVDDIPEESLPWFDLGLKQSAGDVERALEVAAAQPELVFYPQDCCVSIHGLTLRLPNTPFIYYLWYANHRLRDDNEEGGWFANPPSNRSDHEGAAELLDLMATFEGHSKAARDLREKGLRSRTLDQNRSKVKDHLTNLLGEALAQEYLFEGLRDARTARSRYRIALPAARIQIKDVETALPSTS